MPQRHSLIVVDTPGPGLVDITDRVLGFLREQPPRDGLLTLFCRHTSASLLINENAAPAVRRDIAAYFAHIAPESERYEHDDEGADDMPAHLRTALSQVSLSIPVIAGRMVLGTWQGIFLFEHRARPHRREVVAHLLFEP